MTYWQGWAVGLALLLAAAGCGGSNGAPQADAAAGKAEEPAADTEQGSTAAKSPDAGEGPKAALEKFLSAIKSGDDEGAASMLTPLARQKTAEMGLNVAPPGSDTATFKVSQIEMKGTNGAYVACEWNEIDDQGEVSSDQVVWVMSKQEDGWRIAGMVAKVFPDLEAIVFNFEDPEDMIRKQEMAMQEMERRAALAAAKATGESPPSDSGQAASAGPPAPQEESAAASGAKNSATRPPRTKRQ